MDHPSQGRSQWIDLRLAEEHTRGPSTVIVQKTCPLVSTLAIDELSITMYQFSRSLTPPINGMCLLESQCGMASRSMSSESTGHWFTIATSVNLDTITIPNTFEEAVKSRFAHGPG